MGTDFLRHRARRNVATALVMGLIAAAPLGAQTTSASISGIVQDAQGGVLPGVTVVLTSESKGTTQTAVTDGRGTFLFVYVPPDAYVVRVSLAGFQTFEETHVEVNANDRVAVGPYALQLGGLTESVIVTGLTPDIQLKSGERAYTLESGSIRNIAVNGRNFLGLAFLAPGVISSSLQPETLDLFYVNGQRANSNNMTIDGVANIDTGNNGGNMATTNLDAIAEFKVLASSYQAEFGRAVGAQVQVVTKSGSRKFTGSAYWFARRSTWNANTWFNNRSGTPLPDSSRNDSGFTFGGPLYIPKVLNTEKNKLFFFFSQEFQRRKDPVTERRVTVPTALERQGDFSQSVDFSGAPYPYIRDYTTGLPCSAANTSGCFRDGGVLGRIPASRLYAPTLAALSIFPLPNTAGVGYNYRSQTPSKQPLNQTMLRADYQLNASWRLTGRYMFHTSNAEQPYGVANVALAANVDTLEGHSDNPAYNWLASTTGILNNTTSLEVSVGSAHNAIDIYTTNTQLTRAAAGMSSLPVLYTAPIQQDMIPTFTFAGGRIGTPAVMATGMAPFSNFNTTYDIVANLTKVMGSHAAKAGFYFQKSLKDQSAFSPINGYYAFDNSANNPYDAQHPYANAALGVYTTFQQASAYLKPKWRYSNYEWYVQDNWRTGQRLTLDYGLRFYYLTPQWDVSEKASNLLPEKFDAASAVRLYTPAVVNGVRVGYDPATNGVVNANFVGRIVPNSGDPFQGTIQGGTLTDGNKFRVSPRLGFAYDITGKQAFVARGAFGILYNRPQGNQVYNLINNPPGMQIPMLTWGMANNVAGATGLNAPVSLAPNVYEWTLPTVYQWNLGIQMKLPAAFTFDVAYVGSESRHLLQKRQINAPPYGTAYQASSQDPTRGQACSGCPALSPIPGGNALPTDLLRPDQGYGAINLWEFSAYSNYKALQTSINRRFREGLMFGVSYVLSSAKGIASDDWIAARIDGKDREANYGPLSYDATHVMVTSVVYQTPRVANGALGLLTNDWQISGNYRWMSGTPYYVSYLIPGISNINLTGSDQPARIVITGDPGSGHGSDPYQLFNTSAFAAPSAGSNGLESPLYYLRMPPINNLDLSVSKSIPLGGRRRLEVRLDAFNALNTVQWSSVNQTARFASMGSSAITNLANEQTNPTGFGAATAQYNPRQLQLMMRFIF